MGLGATRHRSSLWEQVLDLRAAVVARYAGVPSRVVFSLTGLLVLVLWLLPESVGSKVWGDLEQGIEMFFWPGSSWS